MHKMRSLPCSLVFGDQWQKRSWWQRREAFKPIVTRTLMRDAVTQRHLSQYIVAEGESWCRQQEIWLVVQTDKFMDQRIHAPCINKDGFYAQVEANVLLV